MMTSGPSIPCEVRSSSLELPCACEVQENGPHPEFLSLDGMKTVAPSAQQLVLLEEGILMS